MFTCGDEYRQSTRQTTWNSHHVSSSMNRICRAHVLFSFFLFLSLSLCRIYYSILQTFSFVCKKITFFGKMSNCLHYRSRHSSVITSIFIVSKVMFFKQCSQPQTERIKMVRFFVVELSTKISMINRLKRMIYFVWHWRVWHSKPSKISTVSGVHRLTRYVLAIGLQESNICLASLRMLAKTAIRNLIFMRMLLSYNIYSKKSQEIKVGQIGLMRGTPTINWMIMSVNFRLRQLMWQWHVFKWPKKNKLEPLLVVTLFDWAHTIFIFEPI